MLQSSERSRQFWDNPPRWAYAIVFPWVVGLMVCVYQSHHFHQVAGRQRTTAGQIVAHEPSNHNRYGYTFSVDGRKYRGWQSADSEDLTVGRQVRVFYDPADPKTNALTEFSDLSWREFGPVPFLSIATLGATGIVFGLRRSARIRGTT